MSLGPRPHPPAPAPAPAAAVPSRDAPDPFRAGLDAVDWSRLYAQLLRLAFRRARTRATAEDTVQEALRRGLEPGDERWDSRIEPDLARHVLTIVDRILHSERKKAQVREEPRNLAAAAERTTPRATTPEDDVLNAERDARAQRLLAQAGSRLVGDALAHSVFKLSCDGLDAPAAQVEALGRTIEEIRSARRRVNYAIEMVLAEDSDDTTEPKPRHDP